MADTAFAFPVIRPHNKTKTSSSEPNPEGAGITPANVNVTAISAAETDSFL